MNSMTMMIQIKDIAEPLQHKFGSFFSSLKSRGSETASNKPPWYADPPKGTVKTIMGDDGDIIDCVDFYKQPAFDHPRLKSYKPELEHTKHSTDDYDSIIHPNLAQSWHMNGCCPTGTIPIRRGTIPGQGIHEFLENLVSSIRMNLEQMIDHQMKNIDGGWHQYAVTRLRTLEDEEIQGAKATFSVWKPKLEDPHRDFSLSQMWLANGKGSNLSTIEVGWQNDRYRSNTNYNLEGPTGFVQTNQHYAIGAGRPSSLPSSSTYNDVQQELNVEVARVKGKWRLLGENEEIGYWPDEYFDPSFEGSMDNVSWGGEICTTSRITSTEMGNGHSPVEGYNKAAYIRNLKYIDLSGKTISIKKKDLATVEDAPYHGEYKYIRTMK